MNRLYSNGPSRDFVINPFEALIRSSKQLSLAAPYFTLADEVVQAAREGKTVQLLVGLNAATSPKALAASIGVPNLSVRYLTHRFHAKIYLFDGGALVGSSNLTEAGMMVNREATVFFDAVDDMDVVEDVRALFHELWDSAPVLTDEKLGEFKRAMDALPRQGPDPDELIEKAVGRAEPPNIDVASRRKSRERIFLDALKRRVYEQYRPAFNEVSGFLESHALRRPDLASVGMANEANRFLNWVRLAYAHGDESWQTAPLRSQAEREVELLRLGTEWVHAERSHVPDTFVTWLDQLQEILGSEYAIQNAPKDDLTLGLMSLHAFTEQLRFVKGGTGQLPVEFWRENQQDVARVKRTLGYLLHGGGDFVERLHDVLYDRHMKLKMFGIFCALELFGTLKPSECPPINGRMAKSLRYLGYDVQGT